MVSGNACGLVKVMIGSVVPSQTAIVPLIVGVGVGRTLRITFCVKACEHAGLALVIIIPVICNVCPLLAAVRLDEVKLASPEPFATTPVTSGFVTPSML